MKFRKLDHPVSTNEMYYDLFDGGYISPEYMLENNLDVVAVLEAISTIQIFLAEAQEAGSLEVD